MPIILSIITWISNFFKLILSIFTNKTTKNKRESKVTRSKLCAPPRAQKRLSRKDFRDENVRFRRFHSSPCLPSRLPKSFPLIRNPSEICLLGSNRATPIRPKDVSRIRRANINLNDRVDDAFIKSYSEMRAGDAMQEDLLIVDLPNIYTNRTSDANFDSDAAVDGRLYMPPDRAQFFGEPLRRANLSYDHFPAQESGGINRRRKNVIQDFCPGTLHKGLKSPSEFHSASEDHVNRSLNDSSDGYDDLPIRYLQLKDNSRSTPGYFHQKTANSRIPVRSSNRDAQRRRSLSAVRRNLFGFQEKKGSEDTGIIKSDDSSNWITFRNDISAKFERMFKSLTKKKHQSTGNIIDAFLHIQWMQLAGLTFDKDGAMFRNFAGGKVVLTFGEYKFLIHKICTAHESDYWEVLRKMAAFGEDEF